MEWCEVLILGGSIYFGSERAYADDEEKLIRVSCWEEVWWVSCLPGNGMAGSRLMDNEAVVVNLRAGG